MLDYHKRTRLHLSANSQSTVQLRARLEMGDDVNAKDANGETPFLTAVSFRCADAVQLLLDNGSDIDTADGRGKGCLHWSAMAEDSMVLWTLLWEGACLNSVDSNGFTALHWAAMRSNVAVATCLLACGCCPDAPGGKSITTRTPLHVAIEYYKPLENGEARLATIEAILASGASLEGYCNPIPLAVHMGYVEGVRLLLGFGASISGPGKPLALAASESGKAKLAKLLLDHGAPEK